MTETWWLTFLVHHVCECIIIIIQVPDIKRRQKTEQTNSCISTECLRAVFNGFQHLNGHFQQKWILRCLVQIHAAFNQLCTDNNNNI